MASRRISVVTAGLSQPSSSRLLADRLADATVARLRLDQIDVAVDVFELRDIATEVTNNLLTGFPSPALGRVIDTVTTADGLIVVSPIFTSSYSGLFKSFVDLLEPQSLSGMPVLMGATGGTPRHSLALEYSMRPLFTYLHAVVVPTAVFAATADWGTEADVANTLPARIERAGAELAELVSVSTRSPSPVDPLALTTSFTDLLGEHTPRSK